VTLKPFDRDFWEQRWAQALREQPDTMATRPPSTYLVNAASALRPGLALDAGCGHGSEAIWLAASGWQVTAVDFAVAALEYGRSTVQALGEEVAARIDWVAGDLGVWAPPPGRYDLVSCLFVHVDGPVDELVARLGAGVAPGGTMLLVGHQGVDPATGAPTPAAGQVQVSVDAAVKALDPEHWDLQVAQEQLRAAAGTGVDAVVRAVRRPG
jgi:SAM-dependent methyltransferase